MSSKKGISAGILAGLAIGVGIGIMMAPDKGANTRQKIREGYDGVKEDLKSKFSTASADIKDRASKIDLHGSYDDLVAAVSSKADDVIAFLETKLESLKSEAARNNNNSKNA